MTRSIIASSLKFRVLVVLVAAAVMVVGVLQLRKAPVDVAARVRAAVRRGAHREPRPVGDGGRVSC